MQQKTGIPPPWAPQPGTRLNRKGNKYTHIESLEASLFRLLAVKVLPFLFHFESMVLLLSQNPLTVAQADVIGRYTCISSHQLHRMNEPGILSMDIHPSKVSFDTWPYFEYIL